jgi:hypothetical protein
MKHLFGAILFGIASVTAFAGEAEYVPGEYVVQLKQDANFESIRSLEQEGQVRPILKEYGLFLVTRPKTERPDQAIKFLSKMNGVKYAEPNYIYRASGTPISNDPSVGQLWGLENRGQLEPKNPNATSYSPRLGIKGVDIEVINDAVAIHITRAGLGGIGGVPKRWRRIFDGNAAGGARGNYSGRSCFDTHHGD